MLADLGIVSPQLSSLLPISQPHTEVATTTETRSELAMNARKVRKPLCGHFMEVELMKVVGATTARPLFWATTNLDDVGNADVDFVDYSIARY
jgi:hypothetical protein